MLPLLHCSWIVLLPAFSLLLSCYAPLHYGLCFSFLSSCCVWLLSRWLLPACLLLCAFAAGEDSLPYRSCHSFLWSIMWGGITAIYELLSPSRDYACFACLRKKKFDFSCPCKLIQLTSNYVHYHLPYLWALSPQTCLDKWRIEYF